MATLTNRTQPLFSNPTLKPRTRRPGPARIRMSLQESGPSLAVVGQEFLSDRDFPYRSIKMLASRRSAGKQMTFQGRGYTVEELTAGSFDGVDIALFSSGGSISKEFGPVATAKGAVVVDNSSAFRMDETVPLVNPEAMAGIKAGSGAAHGCQYITGSQWCWCC